RRGAAALEARQAPRASLVRAANASGWARSAGQAEARAGRSSVRPANFVRAVEGEGRHGDVERLAVSNALHRIGADHDARRRGQGRGARIAEAEAGLDHRLLADDAGSAHFLREAILVGDLPVAGDELHRLVRVVLDLDR